MCDWDTALLAVRANVLAACETGCSQDQLQIDAHPESIAACPNVRNPPIADTEALPHQPLMRICRGLGVLLLLAALSGCTKKFEIKLTFLDRQPVLTFYTSGLFPRRLDSICLWSAEIIDSLSGKVVLKLLASDYERACAPVSQVTFGRPEQGLKHAWRADGLAPERSYHVEVSAKEGVGKSGTWRQP